MRKAIKRVVHRHSPMTRQLHRLWVKSKKLDERRHALPQGRRVAKKSGHVYYESRANRSDKSGKRYKVGKSVRYRL